MTDPSMSDTALIDRLAELGEQLDDDLVDASDGLRRRGRGEDPRRTSERSGHNVFARRAGLWSLAAAVVLLVVVLVALPGPRRTIARWFGVGSVRIEPVATTPASSADRRRPTRRPCRPRPDADRPFAWPIRSRPARSRTAGRRRRGGRGDRPAAPGGDGRSASPSRSTSPAVRRSWRGTTSAVARCSSPFSPGRTDEPAFVKEVAPARSRSVDVPGVDGESARGLWIEGEPHTFGYLDADGEPGERAAPPRRRHPVVGARRHHAARGGRPRPRRGARDRRLDGTLTPAVVSGRV